ncbi:MAG: endonuclease [Ferrimonas sp.]
MRTFLFPLSSVVIGLLSNSVNANLLLTEYIEGSSNNKAIEITNRGSSSIDLDANLYQLTLYSNGNTTSTNSQTLTGVLATGASMVWHNSNAAAAFQIGSSSNVTNFNGDDALLLTKDGMVIDRFGQLGQDPGSAWLDLNNATFSTQNKTLRRLNSVTSGDLDASAEFPGSPNQWLTFEQDNSEGLGCDGESACSEPVLPNEPEAPTGPCNGCETLTAVADPNTFNGDIYYSAILSGDFADAEAMKHALSDVIRTNHTVLSYAQVWSLVSDSDQDPSDNSQVVGLYSGKSISQYANGGDSSDWNREHVWPSSHGFADQSQTGYTDGHHLRATLVPVNSARSNFDFASGGSALELAPESRVDPVAGTFEPRDAVKGDVARMMFYMDTRYQGAANDGNMPDLILVDSTNSNADAAEAGKLCELYQWHQQDPVDDQERWRNDIVYQYQGNRNPYIDYPNWVQQIYGAQCSDAPATSRFQIHISGPSLAVAGETLRFMAQITPNSDDSSSSATSQYQYQWQQLSGPSLTMTNTNSAAFTVIAPVTDSERTLTLQLTVSDGEYSQSQTVSVQIQAMSLTLSLSGPSTVTEGDAITLTSTLAHIEQLGAVHYQWQQLSGTRIDLTNTSTDGSQLSVNAPAVVVDQTLQFQLTVDGDHGSVSRTINVAVKNQLEDGWQAPQSSAGHWGLGWLLAIGWGVWQRRQQHLSKCSTAK